MKKIILHHLPSRFIATLFCWAILLGGDGVGGDAIANNLNNQESPNNAAHNNNEKIIIELPMSQFAPAANNRDVASNVKPSGGNSGNNVQEKTTVNLVDGPALCDVQVSQYNTVDIHAQNVKISTLLQQLAVKSRRNIVLAAGADRVVSLTMYAVPFYDALTVALDVNGLGYYEENDFIKVFTKDELRQRALGKMGLESMVFKLNYLRPQDAKAAVQNLLSPDGKVVAIEDDQAKGDKSGGKDTGAAAAKKADEVYKPAEQPFVFSRELVVYDYRDNVIAIANLLAQLDKRPKQVLIEATILSVKLDDKNAMGVDINLLPRTANIPFASPNFTPADNSFHGALSTTPVDEASFRAGFAISGVSMFITALNQFSDVNILSRPKVMSLDRQRAKVLVGDNTGYLETSYSNGQLVQSVKFLETGISLDVRPHILEDGKIRLTVSPKYSSVTFENYPVAAGTTGATYQQKVPSEHIQSVSADILVPYGATAVIGGLFVESTTNERSQIPGVGDLPVVGVLGRQQKDNVIRRELIFMITPTVVSEEEVAAIGSGTGSDTEQLLSGQREGLLPWSRARHSEQLAVRAFRYALSRKNGLGEWTYRRSLQLNNTQPPLDLDVANIPSDGVLHKSIRQHLEKTCVPYGDKRLTYSPFYEEAMPEME